MTTTTIATITTVSSEACRVTREAVINEIQMLYDNRVLSCHPINTSTISDTINQESRLWMRGVNIEGYHFHTRLGMLYKNMKDRCLVGGSKQKNQPYYANTTMCDEWLGVDGFDNFAQWASTQGNMYQVDERGQLFELDKDLLGGNKKQYSFDTCTMLPKAINVALAANGSKGYHKTSSGNYSVRLNKYGKSVHIGTFDTEKEAKASYRKARKQYIRELAKKYKHQLSIEAYEALMRYKQV